MLLLSLTVLFSAVMAQSQSERLRPELEVPTPKGTLSDPPKAPDVFTGKLIREMAIGGETTGWAVDLDEPLQIKGKTLKRIGIDPAGWAIGDFENQRVKIIGILEKRSGIERGEYWVIKVVGKIRFYSDQ